MQDRPYWNMEIEPLLNTEEMRRLQLQKLRRMLGRLKAKAPFYASMLDRVGLDPEKLRGFEEFRDKVEIFTKETFRGVVEQCGNDYLKALDQIMPVRVEDLAWMATTTGTTGVPTPYPLTNHDVQNFWGEVEARGGWRVGMRPGDRVLYCFALSMVIAGVPSMLGFQKTGAMILPVGAEAKSERILLFQNLFRGTVYVGTPSLAEYLIEQAPRVAGRPVADFGFKALICGGEPGAGIPAVRSKLEQAYGCKVYDMGAGFGCSCDHEEYQGMHCVADDLCYYELVDPETKAPIPLEDGAQGEALWTTLDADGWVWIRQSLGDIQQVFTEPCPCGRTGFRYKVVGRADDMLKVKGVMVYPSHLKGVINEFVPRVTGELRIVLDEPPPRVVPPLQVRLEHAEGVAGPFLEALETEILDAMSKRLKIRPKLLWAEPGSLERSHYKGQVFEKTYEKA
ncbi:MAG: AMP-binding protein [Deltaproteobacteria bacterium]|nr:AMP-binding protein [Deltaproteobacteria bacterium]